MLAQQKARELNLSCIDSDVLLYGILAEGTNAIAKSLLFAGDRLSRLEEVLSKRYAAQGDLPRNWIKDEIPFSPDVNNALASAKDIYAKYSGASVEPEHIYLGLLQDLDLQPLLDDVLPDWQNFGKMAANFPKQYNAWPNLNDLQGNLARETPPPAAAPRTLEDWFTKDAIETVAQAEEYARLAGSEKISVDHLLTASVYVCHWMPRHLAIDLPAPAAVAKPGARKIQTAKKSVFADEITPVLITARKEAVQRGCTNIGSGHILLALLKTVGEGAVVSESYSATAAGELYRPVGAALAEHMKEQLPPRVETIIEPLIVSRDKVNATSRFVATIRRALALAHQSSNRCVEVQHIIKALIESARSSEVAFISNHDAALSEVESSLLRETAAVDKKVESSKINLNLLKVVTKNAIEHAKRLESNRLDINHLGLALLDQNESEVELVVEAFGGKHSRTTVRRRLEWCLFYQKFQPGYPIRRA